MFFFSTTRSLRPVLFAVLTAAVLYGCEEADDRGSFAAVEEVILITDPESLSFNSTGLGEESQQILTIQNQSNVPATMIVTLSETPTPNDQNEEFAWAGNLGS